MGVGFDLSTPTANDWSASRGVICWGPFLQRTSRKRHWPCSPDTGLPKSEGASDEEVRPAVVSAFAGRLVCHDRWRVDQSRSRQGNRLRGVCPTDLRSQAQPPCPGSLIAGGERYVFGMAPAPSFRFGLRMVSLWLGTSRPILPDAQCCAAHGDDGGKLGGNEYSINVTSRRNYYRAAKRCMKAYTSSSSVKLLP